MIRLLLALFLLTIPFRVFGQVNPGNGLIACYPFNNSANDESGFNHNGTVLGASPTTDRFGIPQSAYSFDGVDDYIDIGPFAGFTASQEFSISVWIQANQVKCQTILMLQPDDYNDRFNAMAYYDHVGLSTTIWDYGDCTAGGRLIQVGTVFSSAWQHFVYTISTTGGMKVYQNGVLAYSIPSNSQLVDRLRNLWIGGGSDINGIQFYFDGKIDDLRLYDRPLNAAEAQTLYTMEMLCQPSSTGISAVSVKSPFSVSVTNGVLTVHSELIGEKAEISIYSSSGQAFLKNSALPGGEILLVRPPSYGMLIYSIRTATMHLTGKIMNAFY
jgi:hypothetical protein